MATKKDHARAVSLLDELRQFFTGKNKQPKKTPNGAAKSKKKVAAKRQSAKKPRKSKVATKR